TLEAERHPEPPRHLAKRPLERQPVGVQLALVEADTLEELRGNRIGVLIRVEDVGAVAVEHLREGRDDALAIGARDEEGRGLTHGSEEARERGNLLAED